MAMVSLVSLLCIAIIVVAVVALVFVVAVGRRPRPAPPGPLADAAAHMGLRYSGGKLEGTYREHLTTIEPQKKRPGVTVTVQAKQPIGGEVRFSGPSPNAGTGTPEVKITTGNGAFDYHFWIIKSEPRELAQQLFGTPDDLTGRMVDEIPFGQWTLAGQTLAYTGYDTDETPLATDVSVIERLADTLIELAYKVERDG